MYLIKDVRVYKSSYFCGARMQRDDTSEQDKEIESHNDGTLTPVCLCNEPRSHRLRVISTSISGKCSSKPDRVATDMIVLFIRPLALLAVERVQVVYQPAGHPLVSAGHPFVAHGYILN